MNGSRNNASQICEEWPLCIWSPPLLSVTVLLSGSDDETQLRVTPRAGQSGDKVDTKVRVASNIDVCMCTNYSTVASCTKSIENNKFKKLEWISKKYSN